LVLGATVGAAAVVGGILVYREIKRVDRVDTPLPQDKPYEPQFDEEDFDAVYYDSSEEDDTDDRLEPREDSTTDRAANRDPGIVVGDELQLISWDRWMSESPQAIKAAMKESDDPEQIVLNTFRRLYPNMAWPPEPGSPLWDQYQEIVAAVGRTLERPFRTHFTVVS
jgi:hypothetical protein